MTQRNFEHISSEIEKKSGILISGITIKRLSKGAFNRSPQIATLNAIANYFDFKTWQEYKSSLSHTATKKTDTVEIENTATEVATPNSHASKNVDQKGVRPKWIILSLMIVFISGFYFLSKRNSSKHFEKASFSVHKTTGNDLPNTVVFRYDIDKVAADSFFIQQSWDKNRRVRIYKNNHTLTDIYFEPGYHVAKLIANDSVIKTIDVNIPTDRWVFYANENRSGYQTEYIN